MMLIYSLLHLCGYDDFPIEEIKNFRQLGAKTAGHPKTSYPTRLKQQQAHWVGIQTRLPAKKKSCAPVLAKRLWITTMSSQAMVLDERQPEAIGLAGRHELSKLIVPQDNNNITIDGTVDLADRTDQVMRWASGWHVRKLMVYDPAAIDAALTAAKNPKTIHDCM